MNRFLPNDRRLPSAKRQSFFLTNVKMLYYYGKLTLIRKEVQINGDAKSLASGK
jgi:hypothetical protein